jgi:hypothetical protein
MQATKPIWVKVRSCAKYEGKTCFNKFKKLLCLVLTISFEASVEFIITLNIFL